jgi:hypothetical protein
MRLKESYAEGVAAHDRPESLRRRFARAARALAPKPEKVRVTWGRMGRIANALAVTG